jgi:biopolymer transport protein ExbD
MAFNLTSGAGGRRSRGLPAMAEINVTPFVDVVLVLLIIFIITAHVMDYGIEIDVPKTKTVATSVKDLPIVNVSKAGEVYLGSTPVDHLANLGAEIRAKYPGQTAVYLRADHQTQFDPIAQVFSTLGAEKFAVSVVTQPYDNIGTNRR